MATKNAPRTVKDVPAQEFVVALAQYFRSTGKVRCLITTRSTRSSSTRISRISSLEMLERARDDLFDVRDHSERFRLVLWRLHRRCGAVNVVATGENMRDGALEL